MKEIAIDFLYLDLNTCERCMATDDTLDEALNVLAPVFQTLNCSVTVNKVNITTRNWPSNTALSVRLPFGLMAWIYAPN